MEEIKKNDFSSLIGFILIGLILVGFTLYNKYFESQKLYNNLSNNKSIIRKNIKNININNFNKKLNNELFFLENDKIKITIKSKGGEIYQAKLKKHCAYNKFKNNHCNPLYLINNHNTHFGFSFFLKNGNLVDTKMLNFKKIKHDSSSIILRSKFQDAYIEFYYNLEKDYSLNFKVKTNNLYKNLSHKTLYLNFRQKMFLLEKGKYQENAYTEINYSYNNFSNDDYWSSRSFEEKEKVDWISFKQQFFATILESKNKFLNLRGTPKQINETSSFLKEFYISSPIYLYKDLDQEFIWYFLPLDRDYIKKFNKNFESLIPFGWGIFGWLNVFFLKIYKILEKCGFSAGWIIFLMTIIIKLITSPIMYKQFKQSAMMRILKPELDELNKIYKNIGGLKKQQATMELYKQAGVNPMAGCLPALLQMPLFISLYRFFPNMIDLRRKSFLWAEDLTSYDSIYSLPFNIPFYGNHISLFTILYCIVLLIYTKMTSSNIQKKNEDNMPDMQFLMYIMPLMFIFILNSLASGLSWYYFISNSLSILIILFINKFLINEKAIHEKIQENKSKSIKQKNWIKNTEKNY